MSAPLPFEVRTETLRFLYHRRKLPHLLSAVHSGLRREGLDVSEGDALDALTYLTDAGLTERVPGRMGGGTAGASWRILPLGINTHEETA